MNAIHSIKKIIKNILDNITFFFFFEERGKFASFSLGFFFFLRAYTLWQRVLKIHAVGIFFNHFFFLFYIYTCYPQFSQGGKVGGVWEIALLGCPHTYTT